MPAVALFLKLCWAGCLVLKLLLWIALGALGLLAWKTFAGLARARRQAGLGPSAPTPAPGALRGGEEVMVRCQTCGVHCPASEAVRDARGTFCSAAHRDAG